MNYKMALVGNPNVGKTTIYNKITHSFEHVGNWHGVTVSKTSKSILYDHKNIEITDLPGLYSLTVYSSEEGISRDEIYNGANNVILDICEVNNLSRNLYLTLQLLEAGAPTVLVVNMIDELNKRGKAFNHRKLERALDIPVVPTSGYHSEVHMLLDVSLDYVSSRSISNVDLKYLGDLPIDEIQSIVFANAAAAKLSPRLAAIKVMERDAYIIDQLKLSDGQKKAIEKFGNLQARLASARYKFIDEVTEGVITSSVGVEHHEMHEHCAHDVPLSKSEREAVVGGSAEFRHHMSLHESLKKKRNLEQKGFSGLDRFFLNKYLALPLFALIMLAIFMITFGEFEIGGVHFGILGYWLKAGLEWVIENLIKAPVIDGLTAIGAYDWLVGLLGEGIIDGMGGVLVFLPQIVLMFFFLALLEDSGYISRVAFMTDGMFRKIGLSGRSVFTMLMGFGCSATAVLTARGLEDDTMRKKTVLLTPFMSCSARLPVYLAIGAAYFATGQVLVIMGMYVLGIAVSIGYAAIFEKTKKLKSGELSFIMEMPPYRFPTAPRVLQILWHNAKAFLVRVGTVVFVLNIAVWILSHFSFTFEYISGSTEGSMLGIIADGFAVIFMPLGFADGKAVTALFSGLVAKEAVISTLDSLGGVGTVFSGDYAAASAFSFVVFTLLYVPCIATLVAIKKEIGWKWMLACLGLQLGTAYFFSMIAYWLAVLFIAQTGVAVSLTIIAVLAAVCAMIIVSIIRKRKRGCALCPHCNSCNNNSCSEEKKK